jgi:drug/metabolite transporter (DMT)-like permease
MLEKKLPITQLFFLSFISLLFLSVNSLLCKAALLDQTTDAYSFTFIRLFSGSIVLIFLIYLKEKSISINPKTNWISSFMLFLYAISFSFSYLSLNAGLGALILFATVQLTMIIVALLNKERLDLKKCIGIALALCGLVYLLFPKDDFELSIFHFLLMVIAGVAWGFYTILGKKSKNALKDTAENFIKTIPFLFIFFILFVEEINISTNGVILAMVSGGITSALGYVLWYLVLKNIEILTASIIQLIVPLIAIGLSIILLEESISSTLVISSIMILSGIFTYLYKKE